MYAAVLSSLLMPASVLAFAIVVKYALITLKADANVFTQGYFFLMNLENSVSGNQLFYVAWLTFLTISVIEKLSYF